MAARLLITEALNASPDLVGEGLEVRLEPDLWSRRQDLLRLVGDADGLVVRNQTRVDRELLAVAPRLRVVGRLGAGLDNLDLEALRDRGVRVVSGAGLNARAVAEYVLGAILALARGLARSDREVRSGTWRRHVGVELRGRTLGVVGLGATGSEVCRLGRALGMQVLGHDPYAACPDGVESVRLDELLRRSFVVSLHAPLTPGTHHLIGERELGLMQPGALLVNAARGGLVDETALAVALRNGRLGGAAVDVRPQEPPEDDPLRGLDKVLLTAHLAGLTEESQVAIAAHVLAGVRAAILATTDGGNDLAPAPGTGDARDPGRR
jgi:(S)-sulfolactate dehydrogenase